MKKEKEESQPEWIAAMRWSVCPAIAAAAAATEVALTSRCIIMLLDAEHYSNVVFFLFYNLQEIRKGLLKAAKTTGAWIFTGGTNTGM